jgi:hypothetical protein
MERTKRTERPERRERMVRTEMEVGGGNTLFFLLPLEIRSGTTSQTLT